MNKTILLTNNYSGKPLEVIEEMVPEGFKLAFLPAQTQKALLEQISEADYLLAGGRLKINADSLDKADRLKMIQRSGVGLDALDLNAIKARGIPLYVNQGVNAESVAEHTLLLMLACLRRLPEINSSTKSGIWKKQEQGVRTRELKGKIVGIIGMGNIAKTLVSLLKPFGVYILYHSRHRLSESFEHDNNMTFVDIPELLSTSDIVTLHCALTDDTRNLINTETIKFMKPGSILINTARGGMVETVALADALESGQLSYAALDVHMEEPIPENYRLKVIDNAILTPHIGGVTYDSFTTMMHDAFRNIECYENGEFEKISQYRYL